MSIHRDRKCAYMYLFLSIHALVAKNIHWIDDKNRLKLH